MEGVSTRVHRKLSGVVSYALEEAFEDFLDILEEEGIHVDNAVSAKLAGELFEIVVKDELEGEER